MTTGELAGTEESALPRGEDVPEGHRLYVSGGNPVPLLQRAPPVPERRVQNRGGLRLRRHPGGNHLSKAEGAVPAVPPEALPP